MNLYLLYYISIKSMSKKIKALINSALITITLTYISTSELDNFKMVSKKADEA